LEKGILAGKNLLSEEGYSAVFFFLKTPNIIFSVMQKPFIKCVIQPRVPPKCLKIPQKKPLHPSPHSTGGLKLYIFLSLRSSPTFFRDVYKDPLQIS
jgi:hypothetical protein